MHAGFRRLNRVALIVNWRCWTRQVINLVNFDLDWEGYVVPNDFEPFVADQVLYIAPRSSEKIIETNCFRPLGQETLTEV